MADLVAWLTQILDEDEQVVRTAATEHAIEHDHLGWAHIDWNGPQAEALGQLFAPAAVLADIAAKRAIIALHRMTDFGDDTKRGCEICHEDYSWGMELVEGPCATLRLLASAYTDRAGYQNEWRP